MRDALASVPLMFAQAAAKGGAAKGGAAQGDDYSLLIFWYVPVIFTIFYFVVLRPQHQQDRKRRDLLGTLKKNDRVLTTAGIYGTVMSIDNDQDKVVLRVDDDKGGRLTFTRASIVRVLESAQDKDKD